MTRGPKKKYCKSSLKDNQIFPYFINDLMLNLVIYFYPRRLPAPATFTRTRDLYPRVATPRHLDILLARFQKLRPKWDKMSHFSEFV